MENTAEISLNCIVLTWNIDPEIGQNCNLTFLKLTNNEISEPIPKEIGNLTSLNSLHLASNQITGSMPLAIEYL